MNCFFFQVLEGDDSHKGNNNARCDVFYLFHMHGKKGLGSLMKSQGVRCVVFFLGLL